jgi:hypothetical protein
MTVRGPLFVRKSAAGSCVRFVPCSICGKPVPVPPAYKGNHAAHGHCNTIKDPGP